MTHKSLTADPWQHLRNFTGARIALGRAGGSLPTRAWLEFSLAHARARDAVHAPFDAPALARRLEALGVPVVQIESAAPDRPTYLLRPELGRTLSARSRALLQAQHLQAQHLQAAMPAPVPLEPKPRCDLSIVVADGLSPAAAGRQAVPLLRQLLPALGALGWTLAPVAVASQARVALQDEVGQVLGARLSLMLIGERPGLDAPDSLGAYLVYMPAPGRTDAQRNCVSNIRPEGLTHEAAATTLYYLLTEARRLELSGVALKDGSSAIDSPRERPHLNGC
jgi:ethanolamine ammonia-lyase small subunit